MPRMVRNLVQAEGRRLTRRCSLSPLGPFGSPNYAVLVPYVARGVARQGLCFRYAPIGLLMRIWKKHSDRFENGSTARPAIVAAHPHVPREYWEFLQDVGIGEFVGLCFYEGVVLLGELGLTEAPTDYLAFADDMAGAFYGFSGEGHEVVALDSHGWVLDPLAQSFEQFLADMAT
jgi:hypothetical protein